MPASPSVIEDLHSSLELHAARPAFVVRQEVTRYADLAQDTLALAAELQRLAPQDALVGFLCNRDASAYRAVLAILLAGKGYVPLNPKLPLERLKKILSAAGLHHILIGQGCETIAGQLLPAMGDSVEGIALQASHGAASAWRMPATDPRKPAYLLFTSGSTGEPKGVAVSHGNLAAYLGYITDLYSYGPLDVHSQTFELTFDLSVHDMLCAWTRGGSVVRMGGAELLAPVRVVQRHGITSWFSVPSLGSMLASRGGLAPGAMPSLRVSLFCGEALPASLAAAWAAAAPGSIVENLYGPTEATIAITRYRWDAATSPGECPRGLVPIGRAFDGQKTAVVDDEDHVLRGAGRGMLLLGGSQLTGSYWRDPLNTAEKYRELDGERWYVSGDIVEVDDSGQLYFVGRSDSQVKFHGHRIELAEVEHALRTAVGTDLALVLPWPAVETRIDGLTAVVEGEGDAALILTRLRDSLPDYMVPQALYFVAQLPRNMSGKLDRNALLRSLQNGALQVDEA